MLEGIRLQRRARSVLAFDGHVELDASIMDGRDRRCGAVAGLRSTRAPISAARAVMEESPHVLMSYEGADDFACEVGLEQVPNHWFVTPERRRQLDELLAQGANAFDSDIKYGTIGAVAVDSNGHVAPRLPCGLTAKRWADRRFAVDRGRHLCRRSGRGRQRDRPRRSLHSRRGRP